MSKIPSLVFILCILSVILICTSYKEKDVDKISKVVISRNYPNIQPNGRIKYSENNLIIYYCNEYEIYEFLSNQGFFTFNNKGKAINDSNRIVPEYFVCKKGQTSGITYSKGKGNSVDLYKKSVAKVDSVIYKILFSSLDLDSTNLKLIESKDEILSVVEEKYIPIVKSSNPNVLIDTISFFFSKNMMDISYTLSKKTDSLKGSKFIGYKARFLSKYYGNHSIKIDEIQLNLDMKKVPVDNKEFILSLVERFKKDKHILFP